MNKEIICCELVANLLGARYGWDAGGIEASKNEGSGFAIKSFSEDKELKTNKYDWVIYAALHGQFDKLCEICQKAYRKFEELSKNSWESPENQKIIAYSLSNRELLQEVERRVRNKKIAWARDENRVVGIIANNDNYFCEFSCCADVYHKEFSISAWENPSWPQSGRITLLQEGVQWEATARDWDKRYTLPIYPTKSNQELFKWLEKVRRELLQAWAEDKKEAKDYELLREVEKRMKSREFKKYEPELQNAFKKVREKLKKKTQEWERKFDKSLTKEKKSKKTKKKNE